MVFVAVVSFMLSKTDGGKGGFRGPCSCSTMALGGRREEEVTRHTSHLRVDVNATSHWDQTIPLGPACECPQFPFLFIFIFSWSSVVKPSWKGLHRLGGEWVRKSIQSPLSCGSICLNEQILKQSREEGFCLPHPSCVRFLCLHLHSHRSMHRSLTGLPLPGVTPLWTG